MKVRIILLAGILLLVVIGLFPVDRTCGKKGYSCAYPPRNAQQTACYSVAKKPLIADILNINFRYSTFSRCL